MLVPCKVLWAKGRPGVDLADQPRYFIKVCSLDLTHLLQPLKVGPDDVPNADPRPLDVLPKFGELASVALPLLWRKTRHPRLCASDLSDLKPLNPP